jgi:hypothetical protein
MASKVKHFVLTNKADATEVKEESAKPKKNFSAPINHWTCQSASGSLDGNTMQVLACYFEPQGGGHKYMAASLTSNSVAGTWSATDFEPLLGQTMYNLYAQGNTDPPDAPSGEVDGIYCS